MHRPSSPVVRSALIALALAGLAFASVAGYDAALGRIIPDVGTFYRKRDALVVALPKLTPDEAAKRWLALADTFVAMPRQEWWKDNRDYYDRGFPGLLKALPGPDSWDAIVAGIAARKPVVTGNELALRTLAAALSGDKTLRDAAYARTKQWVAGRAKKNPQNRFSGDAQTLALFVEPGSPEALAAAKVSWDETMTDLARIGETTDAHPYLGSNIPDLVKIFGETKAREDLKKIFIVGARLDDAGKGDRTRALVQELALATVAEQRHPAWFVVTEDSEPALFEALDKEFPDETGAYRILRNQAFSNYPAALARAGRLDDAAKFAVEEFRRTGEMPQVDAWHSAKRIPADALADFYSKVLLAEPAIPVYMPYIHASAGAGRADEALKFLHEVAARKDLSPEAKRELDDCETGALLAADKPDEAIPRLLAVLAEKLPVAPAAGDNSSKGEKLREAYDREKSRRGDSISRVLALGKILKRADLTDAGLAAIRVFSKDSAADNSSYDGACRELEALTNAGRYDEVEKIAGDLLVAQGSPETFEENNNRRSNNAMLALKALFNAYHKSGRPVDAIAVLEKSPQWQSGDLRGISSGDARFVVSVGEDLAALGRKDEAKRLADFAITESPGLDPAYALLLKLDGPGDAFLARMDAQFAKDRFEERPLIWKAQALYDLGKYDEALPVAKAAVAIDPSDGEEGKGDRLRAYAVLADILDKKGDATTAGVYRGAVRAIRIGEDADDLYAAGLLKRALARWEEALTKFADAYCVQSRLAVRYAESGDMEKAEAHYTRAFELMPDSFGRIESHCFGCEGAFRGEVAQGIAEKVFTGIIAKNPKNPQAHYLLGYLRSEEDRNVEAAAAYREAVALDPDYFNAWAKLLALRESADLPAEEIARGSMAMLRLDPNGRHGGTGAIENINDLKFVWRTLVAAGVGAKRDDAPLFPLPAAQARLDKLRSGSGGNFNGFSDFSSGSGAKTLAGAISENRLVKAAIALAQSGE